MNKVVSLGSFWELTAESVAIGESITKKEIEIKERKAEVKRKEDLKFSFNVVNNQKDEIKELLAKAGIKTSDYFPFKTRTNAQGEIEFTPKNIFKMKKDSKKVRMQLEDALEKNKITQEEFKQLSDNLTDMLKENGFDEKKEKNEKEDIQVTEEEINELYKTFNQGVEENMEGLIASIGEESFNNMCKDYEKMDLEERKYRLNQFNSAINKKLKIAGNLEFSTDKNLSFDNSFIRGGYLISEKDVGNMNLRDMTKSMMEKGMVRKLMSDKNQNLTASQRQALYNKIVQQKRIQERSKQMQNTSRQIRYAG